MKTPDREEQAQTEAGLPSPAPRGADLPEEPGPQPRSRPAASSALFKKLDPLLTFSILALICAIAFLVRVFSIVKWESVIHEYDPWFNYRATKYLLDNGFDAFMDWRDFEVWYPLGRYTSQTIYPGLMLTAWALHWLLHSCLLIPVHIREVCVFTAPVFSVFTALATYFFAKCTSGSKGAGFLAALFMSVAPTYISR